MGEPESRESRKPSRRSREGADRRADEGGVSRPSGASAPASVKRG
ncbi:MAG: hypothetical protein M0Z50_19125 [Planctomycetia bacterium]|nr:hypothetical protein [Planctomycetia bacterium]